MRSSTPTTPAEAAAGRAVYRGRMATWGWALLTTRPRLVEWHKVVMVQEVERPSWARYMTACLLRTEAPEVEAEARPGDGPVCEVCLSAND